MAGTGVTYFIFILIGIAILVAIFKNAKWNYPTWKGIIISALMGMLPLYLFFCMMGWMGDESNN